MDGAAIMEFKRIEFLGPTGEEYNPVGGILVMPA
jgi:hypothetical protein